MIQISPAFLTLAAFLIASIGTLVGGGIAWGVLRSTVLQLERVVQELKADVVMLREETGALREEIAEQRGRTLGAADTARHSARH